jgi:hypothetical protein
MKKNFTIILFTTILFVSCKKSDDPQPADTGNIKLGSTWVYKFTDFDESGAVVSTNNITATITGSQTLGGSEFWVMTAGGSNSFIRKGTDGYYDFRNNAVQLQYKIPAAVNDTWRLTSSNSAGDYEDFTVMAINENVTVPMGTVACYFIEGHDSNSLEDKQWYNEASVLVKQLEYDQTTMGVLFVDFSIELVSYTR